MMKNNNVFEFGIVFIFSLVGSLSNDYYKTMSNDEEKIDVARALIGAFTATVLVTGATEQWEYFGSIDIKLLLTYSFIAGALGFSLFGLITRLDIKKILNKKGIHFKGDDEDGIS